MMRLNTAVKISSNWHGGQWSALYQFASSGVYVVENHLRYLQEIESDLHPEYNLHPGKLSKKDEGNLTGLKWFFIRMGEKNGIKTGYNKHKLYGYEIPFVYSDTDESILNKIKPLEYAI